MHNSITCLSDLECLVARSKLDTSWLKKIATAYELLKVESAEIKAFIDYMHKNYISICVFTIASKRSLEFGKS